MRRRSKRLMGSVVLLLFMAVGTQAVAESGSPAPVAFIPGTSVLKLQRSGRALLIVDVRTPEEFEAMHIRGAVNIPLEELAWRYREIPPEGLVVLY